MASVLVDSRAMKVFRAERHPATGGSASRTSPTRCRSGGGGRRGRHCCVSAHHLLRAGAASTSGACSRLLGAPPPPDSGRDLPPAPLWDRRTENICPEDWRSATATRTACPCSTARPRRVDQVADGSSAWAPGGCSSSSSTARGPAAGSAKSSARNWAAEGRRSRAAQRAAQRLRLELAARASRGRRDAPDLLGDPALRCRSRRRGQDLCRSTRVSDRQMKCNINQLDLDLLLERRQLTEQVAERRRIVLATGSRVTRPHARPSAHLCTPAAGHFHLRSS